MTVRTISTIPRLVALALPTSLSCGLAQAQGVGVDASPLVEAVTVEAAFEHLQAFQRFADEGDGSRESSSAGYRDSVLYISDLLTKAGYTVDLQVLPYVFFDDITEPVFEQVAPEGATYTPNDPEGFFTATYSGSGDTTAEVVPVDVILPAPTEANTSTSGCEPDDFANFPAGAIALVQRGTCAFFDKARNAEEAGASGVIIFNEGQEGRTEAVGATLGEAGFTIPVIGTTYATGETLATGGAEARVFVDSITEDRITVNVLADTPVGAPARTTVVGAHLDSVPEGAGIQDNGSGSAALLEVALQLSALGYFDDASTTPLNNRLRFAWWGAEENGLIGSQYYVDNLSESEFEEIALNLNFDMIASPNYVRFVYDGDGSASAQAGPEGSAFIEWLFRDWFESQGLMTEPTAFDGRSDYGPFIAVGIPAGGLFTGAEELKTEEQVGIYGGTAGEAYDACYHTPCDDIDNLNLEVYDQMLDAVAYGTYVFGVNQLPEAMAEGRRAQRADGGVEMDWLANRLVR